MSSPRKKISVLLIAVSLSFLMVQPGVAQESKTSSSARRPRLGGPDSVEERLELDRAEKDVLYESKLLKPYFEWQADIKERYGLSFGGDYTSVYLKSSDSLPGTDDEASSGMLRFFGAWELLGRDTDTTGAVVYKIDHRHRYGATAPGGFSIGNLGNVGSIAPPFSNQGIRLTNLHWQQSWNKGQVVAVAGFLDVTNYVDVFALGSPWLHFTNLAFSIGSATISLPNDATLGAAAGGWLNDTVYIIGGLADTNSDPTDPFEGFDTFFSNHEYFTHVDIGRTTSKDRAFFDNMHLTLWHADEREEADVQDGWGAILSYSHLFKDRWLPFVRAGYAEDGGSLLEKSISAGIGYRPGIVGTVPGNLLGFGVNWGQPNETVFGGGLDEQYTAELFYRLQVTREVAITPDVQLLFNPALNPDEDLIAVFGLRGRLAF